MFYSRSLLPYFGMVQYQYRQTRLQSFKANHHRAETYPVWSFGCSCAQNIQVTEIPSTFHPMVASTLWNGRISEVCLKNRRARRRAAMSSGTLCWMLKMLMFLRVYPEHTELLGILRNSQISIRTDSCANKTDSYANKV